MPLVAELLLASTLCAIAVWSTVETIHHAEFFAALRSRLEAQGGFLGDAIGCPLCLSRWVAAWAALCGVIVVGPDDWLQAVAGWCLLWLVSGQLANFLNDLLHGISRMHATEDGQDE